MGKKNDGSFLQQNKKLMKKIFDEWNSKYRQEMRGLENPQMRCIML